MGALGCTRKATIPQSALRLTAPFTQGGLSLYPHRVSFGPGGVNVGRVQSAVKKMQSLLHVLAFCFFDLLFGVLRGERLAAHSGSVQLKNYNPFHPRTTRK